MDETRGLLQQVFRDREPAHAGGARHGQRRHGGLRGQPDRAGRRGDHLRGRRVRRPAWPRWPSATAPIVHLVERRVGRDDRARRTSRRRSRRTRAPRWSGSSTPRPRPARTSRWRRSRAWSTTAGALLLVDAVTSLGGPRAARRRLAHRRLLQRHAEVPVVPAGPGAGDVQRGRAGGDGPPQDEVPSWYLDMSLIRNYWSADRVYHHTAPVNMTYALREALRARARGRAGGAHRRATARTTSRCAPAWRRWASAYMPEARASPRSTRSASPTASTTRASRARLLERVRHRDRRRPRPVQGQGLAHRPHGRLQHAPQRHAAARPRWRRSCATPAFALRLAPRSQAAAGSYAVTSVTSTPGA